MGRQIINDLTNRKGASSNFRWVSYQRLRMLRTLALHESQGGFAGGGRTGSSEERRRRCLGDESSRPRRSSASPPRRADRGCAMGVPHASALSLAVHAKYLCSRGVRKVRPGFGKVFPLPHGDLTRLRRTGRYLPAPAGGAPV